MNYTTDNPQAVSTGTTLFIVSAVQLLAPFMMSAVGVALPAIGQFYAASAVSLSLVEMTYILALSLFLLPAGRLADIYGRKKVFTTGVIIFTAATTLLPFAPSIWVFIAFRFLQGVGASFNISTSIAILSAVFPRERRGRAMGIAVASVYLGLSAGPTLAGVMIAYLGWKWIFLVTVPISLLIVILTLIFLKGEWKGAQGQTFDYAGSLLYMLSLSGLIVGISHLKNGLWAILLTTFGALGLIGFSVFEYHRKSPIIDMRLILRNKVLAFSNIATWINYAASFGLTFFFSLYLQIVKGLPPQTTGLLLIIQPVIQAALSPVAGSFADKLSPAKMATAGMAICAAGLGLAACISSDSGITLVIQVLIIMGIGFALFSTPNMTTIMGSVEPPHYGIASSLVATMRTLGMLTAMTIITMLLSMFMGNSGVTPETIPGFIHTMRTGFICFSLLSLIGIVFSTVRVQRKSGTMPTEND